METVFESQGIKFVKVSLELVPVYLEMVNDIDGVARFIGDRLEPYTQEEERAYIKGKIDSGAYIYSMLDKKTGEFIGNTEFFNIKGYETEWGIVIRRSMQGKGYGTEALTRALEYGFDELGFKRIYLTVFEDNSRAIHVYKKCGFTEYRRTDKDIFMEVYNADLIREDSPDKDTV
ncbi:MAG: GNAT family N-acetyltransferase [Saccharofermentans sp.]|nr:GNAT family N-acetyltransferase [Saccharofermentans sp.]